MKRILTVGLMLVAAATNAENTDTTKDLKKKLPFYIEVCKDIMTDKEYAYSSKSLLCSEDGKKGFVIMISWKNTTGKVSYSGLILKSVGIGTCNEDDKLLFLFEDDTKYSMSSWQKFNCEGNSYFDLNRKLFDEINTKKIKAIRFENGRSHDSYTHKPTENEPSFFIEAKEAVDKNRIVAGKCDE